MFICRARFFAYREPPKLINIASGNPVRSRMTQCPAPRIEEIRLHANRYASLTCTGQSYLTSVLLTSGEMNELLHRMCNGSLYAYGRSINRGFLSLGDGIRVGVCGRAAVENERVIGVSEITGLILRIPNAVELSVHRILETLHRDPHRRGLLIYSPPGVGKTTLLRAAAKEAASPPLGRRVVVVDTREELCYSLCGKELNLDILSGYPRSVGIEIAVRSLSAELIVCDEIGNDADAEAILTAANCGVPLLATAHGASAHELLRRPALARLHEARVFGSYVGITRSERNELSYRIESAEHIAPCAGQPFGTRVSRCSG